MRDARVGDGAAFDLLAEFDEDELDRRLRAVAQYLDRNALPAEKPAHRGAERIELADGLARDRHDRVARADSRGGGRRTGHDLAHDGAVADVWIDADAERTCAARKRRSTRRTRASSRSRAST
jgi:hypothetical protein